MPSLGQAQHPLAVPHVREVQQKMIEDTCEFTLGLLQKSKMIAKKKARVIFFSCLFRSLMKVFKASAELSFPDLFLSVSPLRSLGVFNQWEQTGSFQSKSFQVFQNAAMDDSEREAQACFSHSDTAETPHILWEWRGCTLFPSQLCSLMVSLDFPHQHFY